VVVIGQAPSWMNEDMAVGIRDPIVFDRHFAAADDPDGGDPLVSEASPRDFFDRYARMRFAQEDTAGNQLVVETYARLDLAPGSLVRVVAPGVPGGAPLQVSCGQVLEVALTLDAGTPAAGARLHLGFVHPAGRRGLPAHPIYGGAFRGTFIA
jgi:hypothetical protein